MMDGIVLIKQRHIEKLIINLSFNEILIDCCLYIFDTWQLHRS